MTQRTLRTFILAADLVWGVLAMPLAYLLRYGWVWRGPTDSSAVIFVPPLMAALLFWSVMSSWTRLDGFRAGWKFSDVVSQQLLAVLALMSALFTIGYLGRQFISRLALLYFGLLLFIGFLMIRVIARSILDSRSVRGMVRNVVIVGSGRVAREVATRIECHPEMLRRVIGFLSPGRDAFQNAHETNGAERVVLTTADIAEMLKAQDTNELILAVPTPSHPEVLDLISRCGSQGITVSMVPQPYELYLTKPELIELDGLPLLQLQAVDPEPAWKRSFDVFMTFLLLPICLPPMLAGAALLKIKNGRAFCRERRCGKKGQEFGMYRLDSPRRVVGLPRHERILQKMSITELPQLFNVLRGEMSLVGPRPEGLDRARRYTDWHRQRLNARPGITGLAQVYGLRDQHPSDDKTRYDLQYILSQSPFQDISLLLQTGWTLTRRLFAASVPANSGRSGLQPEFSETTHEESLIHAHSAQSSAD
ncbi:MAG TPA: sugar transferase [Candidatus Sulfotelmatobacter sp.]|nr:sugar transferase [Candidatus Sulfotelmatobacter sp.]